MLNNLVSIKSKKPSKRLGRGNASGKGQTSGRGTKGQKSRSGYNIPRSFEGGQTPLIQRLAKSRGFHSIHGKPAIVHIVDIEKHFNDGETVNFKTLLEKKLVDNIKNGIKVVGPGKLTKNLRFLDVKLTQSLLEESKSKRPVKVEKPIVESKKVTAKPTVKKVAAKKTANKTKK